METLFTFPLAAILLVAVITDLRSMRIPNWLTLPSILVGVGLHTLTQGTDGLVFSLYGLALGLGVMLLPFIFGVMGAGDVKLMAAVGAFLGAKGVFHAFIWTSLAGGIYALGVLLFHAEQLRAIFRAIRNSLTFLSATGEFSYIPATKPDKLPRLCYGLAIAAGTLFSLLPASDWARVLPAILQAF